MSWDDDARDPAQQVESVFELAEIVRLRKLRAQIRDLAQRRREAGKPEPRGLGS